MTYIPLYLQVVKGASPTESGLQMLPLMAGVLICLDRQRAADHALRPLQGVPDRRHGADGRRHAAALPAHREHDDLVADLYMLVLGLGLGFVMQVLVLAVQNAVDYRDLGVATASATLFRSMGGTIGVPIFGAIFTNQLATTLAAHLPLSRRSRTSPRASARARSRAFRRRSAIRIARPTRRRFTRSS